MRLLTSNETSQDPGSNKLIRKGELSRGWKSELGIDLRYFGESYPEDLWTSTARLRAGIGQADVKLGRIGK